MVTIITNEKKYSVNTFRGTSPPYIKSYIMWTANLSHESLAFIGMGRGGREAGPAPR